MDTTPAADGGLDPFGWMDWLLEGPFRGGSEQLHLPGSPGVNRDDFALPERFEDAELSTIARSLLIDDAPAAQPARDAPRPGRGAREWDARERS
jgi:hypothetical protein